MACVYENDLLKSEKNIHKRPNETTLTISLQQLQYISLCVQFRMKKKRNQDHRFYEQRTAARNKIHQIANPDINYNN